MQRSVKFGACLLAAVIGALLANHLTASRPASGTGLAAAADSPSTWVSRIPLLSRIVAPAVDDVTPDPDVSPLVAEADALALQAASDPAAAMRGAAGLERYWLLRDTQERIVTVWSREAPLEALAYLNRSRDLGEARQPLRVLALETWARTDPVGALNYLSGPAGNDLFFLDQPLALEMANAIAGSEPYLTLTRADARSPGRIRDGLRQAAIAVLVDRDPEFAERQLALAVSEQDRAEWALQLRLAEQRAEARRSPETDVIRVTGQNAAP